MIFHHLSLLLNFSLKKYIFEEETSSTEELAYEILISHIYNIRILIRMGGCMGSAHQSNTESINLHVKRMRHYIDVEVQKQIKECTTLEKMLINEFSK